MNIYDFDYAHFILFFGAFVRISAFMLVLPIFSNNAIPSLVKILLSFSLLVILFPSIQIGFANGVPRMDSLGDIFVLVAKELFVGLTVGFLAKLIFESIAFGFSYLGLQMGFGFSSLYDPNTEANTPVVSKFLMVIVSLLFITFDGHYMIILSISETFNVVPLGKVFIQKDIFSYVIETGSQLFLIAVKLGAPMALIIFLMNITFGVIARAVPQINVLILSFTINILVGFLVLIVMIPSLGTNVETIMGEMFMRVLGALRYLHA